MLSRLKRPKGIIKRKKRVGRGRGSGHGKTSGKGEKGQNARASGGVRPGFEGGQMPLIRRVPKRGFTFTPKPKYEIVALGSLNRFDAGTEVTPELLKEARLVDKKKIHVKILGDGDLKHPLNIKAHAFSRSALEKIKKAGGTANTLKPALPTKS
ncbi:MAG: 50S ribosomal protein L15 [Candidatus Omnitrophica bacterium CG1_02_49_16]|nr:MAG: 50S ribosomal protein L15 [Candidatus Omnitrophica bacterium CG1_02_49_16]